LPHILIDLTFSQLEQIWNTYKDFQQVNESSNEMEGETTPKEHLLNELECGFYHGETGLYRYTEMYTWFLLWFTTAKEIGEHIKHSLVLCLDFKAQLPYRNCMREDVSKNQRNQVQGCCHQIGKQVSRLFLQRLT
jgi:hypothetical protein